MSPSGGYIVERASFDELFRALQRRGYAVVAPTVRDGAIVYGEIGSAAELPIGWTERAALSTASTPARSHCPAGCAVCPPRTRSG